MNRCTRRIGVMLWVAIGKWYLDRDPQRAVSYLRQRVVDRGSNEDGALDTARALLKQLRGG